jgi:hypothetical protein
MECLFQPKNVEIIYVSHKFFKTLETNRQNFDIIILQNDINDAVGNFFIISHKLKFSFNPENFANFWTRKFPSGKLVVLVPI